MAEIQLCFRYEFQLDLKKLFGRNDKVMHYVLILTFPREPRKRYQKSSILVVRALSQGDKINSGRLSEDVNRWNDEN